MKKFLILSLMMVSFVFGEVVSGDANNIFSQKIESSKNNTSKKVKFYAGIPTVGVLVGNNSFRLNLGVGVQIPGQYEKVNAIKLINGDYATCPIGYEQYCEEVGKDGSMSSLLFKAGLLFGESYGINALFSSDSIGLSFVGVMNTVKIGQIGFEIGMTSSTKSTTAVYKTESYNPYTGMVRYDKNKDMQKEPYGFFISIFKVF